MPGHSGGLWLHGTMVLGNRGSCIGLTGTEGAGSAHPTPSARSGDTSGTRTPSQGTEHLPADGQGPRPGTNPVRGSRVKHSPRDEAKEQHPVSPDTWIR